MFTDLISQLLSLPDVKVERVTKKSQGLCAYKGCDNPRHVGRGGELKVCQPCMLARNRRAWAKHRQKMEEKNGKELRRNR